MELLAPKFHVLAADSYGAGKSPPWPDRPVRLKDEVELLEPVFAHAGNPFALVGHSYGGAIALVAAVIKGHRVSALVLYEPTLFAIVENPKEVEGIRDTVAAAVAALNKGDSVAAARTFIDFWMGPGAFNGMPERNREAIAAAVVNIEGWKDALFGEPTPLKAFAKLDIPVLLMVGKASPLSSRAVAQRLARVLPRVEVSELEALGHMGPVTDPDRVNAVIRRFLERR
jgi:pimeloyl-ACP methyl ester carboxylesterase